VSRVSCLGFNIPVASIDDSPVRAALRTALTGALKQRDRQAAGVYRSALAAADQIADTDAAVAQKLRDEASLLRTLLGSAPTD